MSIDTLSNFSLRRCLNGNFVEDPWSVPYLYLEELSIEVVVQGSRNQRSHSEDKLPSEGSAHHEGLAQGPLSSSPSITEKDKGTEKLENDPSLDSVKSYQSYLKSYEMCNSKGVVSDSQIKTSSRDVDSCAKWNWKDTLSQKDAASSSDGASNTSINSSRLNHSKDSQNLVVTSSASNSCTSDNSLEEYGPLEISDNRYFMGDDNASDLTLANQNTKPIPLSISLKNEKNTLMNSCDISQDILGVRKMTMLESTKVKESTAIASFSSSEEEEDDDDENVDSTVTAEKCRPSSSSSSSCDDEFSVSSKENLKRKLAEVSSAFTNTFDFKRKKSIIDCTEISPVKEITSPLLSLSNHSSEHNHNEIDTFEKVLEQDYVFPMNFRDASDIRSWLSCDKSQQEVFEEEESVNANVAHWNKDADKTHSNQYFSSLLDDLNFDEEFYQCPSSDKADATFSEHLSSSFFGETSLSTISFPEENILGAGIGSSSQREQFSISSTSTTVCASSGHSNRCSVVDSTFKTSVTPKNSTSNESPCLFTNVISCNRSPPSASNCIKTVSLTSVTQSRTNCISSISTDIFSSCGSNKHRLPRSTDFMNEGNLNQNKLEKASSNQCCRIGSTGVSSTYDGKGQLKLEPFTDPKENYLEKLCKTITEPKNLHDDILSEMKPEAVSTRDCKESYKEGEELPKQTLRLPHVKTADVPLISINSNDEFQIIMPKVKLKNSSIENVSDAQSSFTEVSSADCTTSDLKSSSCQNELGVDFAIGKNLKGNEPELEDSLSKEDLFPKTKLNSDVNCDDDVKLKNSSIENVSDAQSSFTEVSSADCTTSILKTSSCQNELGVDFAIGKSLKGNEPEFEVNLSKEDLFPKTKLNSDVNCDDDVKSKELMCGILDNSVVHESNCFSPRAKGFIEFESKMDAQRPIETIKFYNGKSTTNFKLRKDCKLKYKDLSISCPENLSDITLAGEVTTCSSSESLIAFSFGVDSKFGCTKSSPQHEDNLSSPISEGCGLDISGFHSNNLSFLKCFSSSGSSSSDTDSSEDELPSKEKDFGDKDFVEPSTCLNIGSTDNNSGRLSNSVKETNCIDQPECKNELLQLSPSIVVNNMETSDTVALQSKEKIIMSKIPQNVIPRSTVSPKPQSSVQSKFVSETSKTSNSLKTLIILNKPSIGKANVPKTIEMSEKLKTGYFVQGGSTPHLTLEPGHLHCNNALESLPYSNSKVSSHVGSEQPSFVCHASSSSSYKSAAAAFSSNSLSKHESGHSIIDCQIPLDTSSNTIIPPALHTSYASNQTPLPNLVPSQSCTPTSSENLNNSHKVNNVEEKIIAVETKTASGPVMRLLRVNIVSNNNTKVSQKGAAQTSNISRKNKITCRDVANSQLGKITKMSSSGMKVSQSRSSQKGAAQTSYVSRKKKIDANKGLSKLNNGGSTDMKLENWCEPNVPPDLTPNVGTSTWTRCSELSLSSVKSNNPHSIIGKKNEKDLKNKNSQNIKEKKSEKELVTKVKIGVNGEYYVRPSFSMMKAISEMRKNQTDEDNLSEGSDSKCVELPDGVPICHPMIIPNERSLKLFIKPKKGIKKKSKKEITKKVRRKKRKYMRGLQNLVREKVKETVDKTHDEIPEMVVVCIQGKLHIYSRDVGDNVAPQ